MSADGSEEDDETFFGLAGDVFEIRSDSDSESTLTAKRIARELQEKKVEEECALRELEQQMRQAEVRVMTAEDVRASWDTLEELVRYPDQGLCSRLARHVATLVEQKDPRLAIALEQFPAAEWQRDELRKAVQEVVLDDLEAIWDRIMDGCSKEEASDISAQEKADKALTDINLVYGEVEFRTLAFCLWEFVDADAFPQADSVFYDLGSGVGRGIFAALLAHNFSKIIGVEIMEGLHEAGVKQYAHCQEDVLPGIIAEEKVQQVDQKHSILGPQVEFVCDDFNSYDWANGTVVFANSTCYDPALMAEMTRESLKLRLGTYFLTLTKPLESPAWKQIGWRICEMSWGEATIYAHIKILDPPPPTPTLTTAATATSTTAT